MKQIHVSRGYIRQVKSLASMLQVAYKNLTSSECLPRLCRVSGLGLQPLLPQTIPLLLPGVPSHTSSPVHPADRIHCGATNYTGSTAAPKHSEALKMVQNERCYCHASILRFAHSETHPSACWRSHRTSKLQHYDKNTEKNLDTNLASLSEFSVPSRIRVNSIRDFFRLSFYKIMAYFQNATLI